VVEQGVSGNHDPEAFQKARACLTSESEGDVREPAFESLGPASIVRGETGQAFREDRPVASPLVTEEPSDAQMQSNRDSLPGQVGQRPRVPGMDPGGLLSAFGTTSHPGSGPCVEGDGIFGSTSSYEIQQLGGGQYGAGLWHR
jgi:hypothetical protein